MCLKGGDEEEWCEREGPHYDHQSPAPLGLSGSEEAAGGGCIQPRYLGNKSPVLHNRSKVR